MFLKRISRALIVLLCLGGSLAHAQEVAVRGTVTDPAGKPLVGVNVVEKGTTHGTITDTDGRFSLTVSSPEAVLGFSLVGHRKLEMKLQGQIEIAAVLQEGGVELGEVSVVGTRSSRRTVTESPVAIDVIDVAALTAQLGQFEVNQILQYAAPSFNSNRQSGADGADHIDPATLRGLGPDQTLVLVNGKRRHQSSLVNIFGTRGRGNTGTDLNAIPASAIERIEILRDGASAQYGSDAIAGVINIVLKSATDEFTGTLATGAHDASYRTDRSYDGEEFQAGGNYGIKIGEQGFMNMTAEYLRKGWTNRPADPNVYSVYRRQFGDAKLENFGTFFNASIPAGEGAALYGFGGFNYRATNAYAWTRDPDSDRNVPAIYPNGFDPRITSTVTDPSISLGLRARAGDWSIDVNNTLGVNSFHYFIAGTLNASLLENSPTRFDAGGFDLLQNTSSVTFTRFFDRVLSGLNVAFGGEYRVENYTIFAGEEGSWRNYGLIDTVINGRVTQIDTLGRPGGSQGFPGFKPENEVDEFRSNIAGYVDAELDISNRFMIGAAARFESYSDFGQTLTGKLATRYKVTEDLAFRGSVSSGFRAPSLAQIHFNSTFTDFVSGVAVDKLIADNSSTLARKLGIPALKDEKALNVSVGLTATLLEGLTATIDGYYVEIDDRIVLTGAFEDTDPDIGSELVALNVGAVQFFTNAIDTRTRGVDVILTYSRAFGDHLFRVSYAGNFNDMDLGAIHTSPKLVGKEDVYFGRREQHFLLASAPPAKNSLSLDYGVDRFHATVRVTQFGRVALIDWLDTEDVYKAKVTTDLTLGYDITDHLTLIAGSSNLLDAYPTEQDTETETGGMFDALQMGFSGRYYFTRLNIRL